MSFEIDSLRNENLRLKKELKEARQAASSVESLEAKNRELKAQLNRPCEGCQKLSEALEAKNRELKAQLNRPCEGCKKLSESLEAKNRELSKANRDANRNAKKLEDAQFRPGPSKTESKLRGRIKSLNAMLAEARNGNGGK